MFAHLIRVLLPFCVCVSSLNAATIAVSPDGTGDHVTIQAAIDAAASGDEIVLSPGVYTGDGNRDLDVKGKGLTIRSTAPDDRAVTEATIIDAQGLAGEPHRAFLVTGPLSGPLAIRGLTITGGYADVGGGLRVAGDVQLAISCCNLVRNEAGSGGAVYLDGVAATFDRCLFDGNTAAIGAGIYCDGATAGSNLSVVNSIFLRNHGQGDVPGVGLCLYLDPRCDAAVRHCTLVSEDFYRGSSIASSAEFTGPAKVFSHCIIIDWSALDNWLPNVDADITWCAMNRNREGEGNIRYGGYRTSDGHLTPGSACIDAGDPDFDPAHTPYDFNGQPRVAGGRVDIGADEWTDTDGDGMPDWWESRWFGTPTGGDPEQDTQNDGVANWRKYALSIRPAIGVQYYVDPVAGDDAWDGLSAAWDGSHGPKATIRAAVEAASDGDAVVLAPGLYTGDGNRDIDLYGRQITIRGSNIHDPAVVAATVIDCQGSPAEPHRAFYAIGSEDPPGVVISGLTITGGYAAYEEAFTGTGWADGGAIFMQRAPLALSHCVFYGNTAEQGGGAVCARRLLAVGCQVLDNHAGVWGGGMDAGGGYGALIEDCVFRNNSADQRGGGLFAMEIPIRRCVIERNFAGRSGGGMKYQTLYENRLIEDCRISWNTAGLSGAALELAPVIGVTLKNCHIAHNTCPLRPSSLGGPEIPSGAIACGNSVEAINCTIAWNSMPSVSYIGGSQPLPATFRNTIVWGSGGPLFDGLDVTASHSIFSGVPAGDGNLDVDPMLTWDGHLRAGSPAIDAGDPAWQAEPGETDVDGEPRVLGGRIDIGADEWLDTDGDDLPDYWESQWFGAATAGQPGDDLNGTGCGNLASYGESLDPVAPPTTWYVAPDGDDAHDGLAPVWDGTHGPKATIQAGIDAAADDNLDRVIVAPGTYTGDGNVDITFEGKPVTVQGTNPDDPAVVAATVIDGQAANQYGIVFTHGERPMTTLAGLTLANVGGYHYSSLLSVGGSSPTIRDCRIIQSRAIGQNSEVYRSAPVSVWNSSPRFVRCAITDNPESYMAINCVNADAIFQDCTIARNGAQAASLYGGAWAASIYGGRVRFERCTIADHPFGLQVDQEGTLVMRNSLVRCVDQPLRSQTGTVFDIAGCTFVYQDSTIGAWGAAGQIANCIFLKELDTGWRYVGAIDSNEFLTVSHSVVYYHGASSIENLTTLPAMTDDYHLLPGSIAIDAGDPAFVPEPGETDIDGQIRVTGGRVDIGADEWTIPGDADGDDQVNVKDLLILAHSFARTQDQFGYDRRADFNRDGYVDVVDLLTLAHNFATSR